MLDEAQAIRIGSWVDEAVAAGGRLLAGGTRQGAFYAPTVLADVPPAARICRQEAFAPIVTAVPFREIREAIEIVNDSDFGLQAGLFTNDLTDAFEAFAELEVGGVILNDVPTYRIDHMPYGGVKD